MRSSCPLLVLCVFDSLFRLPLFFFFLVCFSRSTHFGFWLALVHTRIVSSFSSFPSHYYQRFNAGAKSDEVLFCFVSTALEWATPLTDGQEQRIQNIKRNILFWYAIFAFIRDSKLLKRIQDFENYLDGKGRAARILSNNRRLKSCFQNANRCIIKIQEHCSWSMLFKSHSSVYISIYQELPSIIQESLECGTDERWRACEIHWIKWES